MCEEDAQVASHATSKERILIFQQLRLLRLAEAPRTNSVEARSRCWGGEVRGPLRQQPAYRDQDRMAPPEPSPESAPAPMLQGFDTQCTVKGAFCCQEMGSHFHVFQKTVPVEHVLDCRDTQLVLNDPRLQEVVLTVEEQVGVEELDPFEYCAPVCRVRPERGHHGLLAARLFVDRPCVADRVHPQASRELVVRAVRKQLHAKARLRQVKRQGNDRLHVAPAALCQERDPGCTHGLRRVGRTGAGLASAGPRVPTRPVLRDPGGDALPLLGGPADGFRPHVRQHRLLHDGRQHRLLEALARAGAANVKVTLALAPHEAGAIDTV
mmetsp:Transcript_117586/g.366280  ORF Transcript_117586/g.366280 Transcript_117586/m.366280 type:complete len:324 (+) Transcript_117586:933-1904(+)